MMGLSLSLSEQVLGFLGLIAVGDEEASHEDHQWRENQAASAPEAVQNEDTGSSVDLAVEFSVVRE